MVTRRKRIYRKRSRKNMCKCTSKCKKNRRGKGCACRKCKFCKQKGGATWYSGFVNLMTGKRNQEEEKKEFDDTGGQTKPSDSVQDSSNPEKKKNCDDCEKNCDNLKDPSKMSEEELLKQMNTNITTKAQQAADNVMQKSKETAAKYFETVQQGVASAASTAAAGIGELGQKAEEAAKALPGANANKKESTEAAPAEGAPASSDQVKVTVGGRRRRRRRRKSKKKKKSRRRRKSRRRIKSRRRRKKGGNHELF